MYFFLKSFGPNEEVFDRLGFLREVVGDDGFGGEDFGGLVRVCFGVKVDEGVVGFGGEVFGGLVLVCFCGDVDHGVSAGRFGSAFHGFGVEVFGLDPVCFGEGVAVVAGLVDPEAVRCVGTVREKSRYKLGLKWQRPRDQ